MYNHITHIPFKNLLHPSECGCVMIMPSQADPNYSTEELFHPNIIRVALPISNTRLALPPVLWRVWSHAITF